MQHATTNNRLRTVQPTEQQHSSILCKCTSFFSKWSRDSSRHYHLFLRGVLVDPLQSVMLLHDRNRRPPQYDQPPPLCNLPTRQQPQLPLQLSHPSIRIFQLPMETRRLRLQPPTPPPPTTTTTTISLLLLRMEAKRTLDHHRHHNHRRILNTIPDGRDTCTFFYRH